MALKTKLPDKNSRKGLIKRVSFLMEELNQSRKREVNLNNLSFFIAVRLYEISPEDELFNNAFFKEDFIDKIKLAVKKRAEAAQKAKEIAEKPDDSNDKP